MRKPRAYHCSHSRWCCQNSCCFPLLSELLHRSRALLVKRRFAAFMAPVTSFNGKGVVQTVSPICGVPGPRRIIPDTPRSVSGTAILRRPTFCAFSQPKRGKHCFGGEARKRGTTHRSSKTTMASPTCNTSSEACLTFRRPIAKAPLFGNCALDMTWVDEGTNVAAVTESGSQLVSQIAQTNKAPESLNPLDKLAFPTRAV
mmetsp:Transcript_83226/g.268290  ORF Transcript_83226/g.268290 Transcript_83226/m.268290 type:complete len:201 (-) Transcript_83226:1007-1609(-)